MSDGRTFRDNVITIPGVVATRCLWCDNREVFQPPYPTTAETGSCVVCGAAVVQFAEGSPWRPSALNGVTA